MSAFRKTITIPGEGDKPKPKKLPLLPIFVGGSRDRDLRDVTKPVGYDAQGRPLFAPRGRVYRLPWP